MNYALCYPLLSHMPLMKLCPLTTMHLLPPYAYFTHDHPDILSTLEQLQHLVTSGTSTPLIFDDILDMCILISDSSHSSVEMKDQLRIFDYDVHPDTYQLDIPIIRRI